MKKLRGKRPVGRPPGRKAVRRPVIATRAPLPFYERLKLASQISGRTLSEELVWRTTQSLERDNILDEARKERDTILDEAREKLAAARHITEEAFLREQERRYTQIHGLDGSYWMPKGAKPLLFSITPEFQAVFDAAVKKAFDAAKGEPK